MIRPTKQTTYHLEYPTGALQRVEDVLDLVIEARKSRKAIRIYTVNQSGHIRIFFLTSKTKLYRPGGKHPDSHFSIDNVNHVLYPIYDDYGSLGYTIPKERWMRNHQLLESYGIKSRFQTAHRMFTNKMAAGEYSQTLKNDPQYMKEVREWHDFCNELFSDISY